MKNYLLYVKLVCAISGSAILLMVFTIITMLNGYIYLKPFAFDQEYFSFIAISYEQENPLIIQKSKEDIRNIVSADDNIIVVKLSSDYGETYLYDPSCYYANTNYEGQYFSKEDFVSWQSNSVMVDECSVYHQMIVDGKLYLNGEYKKAIATYQSDYPLKFMGNSGYIIEPLSSSPSIAGTYYLSNCDVSLAKKVISSLSKSGYVVEILHDPDHIENNISIMLGKIEFLTLIPSLLIILFTDFVTLRLLFSRIKRLLQIHCYCGATKGKLLLFIWKEMIGAIVIGTIAGTFSSSVILYGIFNEWSFLSFGISSFLNMVLLLLIVAMAFLLEIKSNAEKGW